MRFFCNLWQTIADIARLGAERFVHVGRGVVLNARGWREAALSVARRGHGIERFEILDDAGHPDRVDGALGAACFGWSTVPRPSKCR